MDMNKILAVNEEAKRFANTDMEKITKRMSVMLSQEDGMQKCLVYLLCCFHFISSSIFLAAKKVDDDSQTLLHVYSYTLIEMLKKMYEDAKK